MTSDEWLLWQLADSAFPAGGLAHSNGLEAAVQHGIVSDGVSLEEFLRTVLQQCVRGVLQFARAARKTPEQFSQIDAHCDLFLNNHVTNRASRSQGQALLAASARIFADEKVVELSHHVRAVGAPAHYAPVFGLILATMNISENQTDSLFMFLLVRSTLGSAVRLGIVGPLEAGRIQTRIRIENKISDNPPVQTAPVLDLLQATQDRLYSRLFQS